MEPPPAPPPAPVGKGVHAILDLIGKCEGTDRGRGYNETLAYGRYTGGQVELTKMSLTTIKALQAKMLKAGAPSTAVGRYQIISKTLDWLIGRYKVPMATLFDADEQDKLACALLELRGYTSWRNGTLSTAAFIDNLAKEWASLPGANGKGKYGQGLGCTLDEFVQVLATV